jgi:hypothetical protein
MGRIWLGMGAHGGFVPIGEDEQQSKVLGAGRSRACEQDK